MLLNFTVLLTVFIRSNNVLVICVGLSLTSTHITRKLISQLVVFTKTVKEKTILHIKNHHKTTTHASRRQLPLLLSHLYQFTYLHFNFSIHLSTFISPSPYLYTPYISSLHSLLTISMLFTIGISYLLFTIHYYLPTTPMVFPICVPY